MDSANLANLRDFVYLDVERVKSLLAQLDRGLLSDRSDTAGSSTSLEGKAGLSIPALLEVGGAGQYVTTDQSTETRTLHDFVYNQTEEKLIERRLIKYFPDDFLATRLLAQEVRDDLSPVEYVLIRGKLTFSDYRYMISFLENFNEISRSITEVVFNDKRKVATSKVDKSNLHYEISKVINSNILDQKYVNSLLRLFRFFLNDRLIIKIIPFPEDPNIRIVGPIQPSYLRERLEDVRFKFGSSPMANWTVFGQIAAVPAERDDRTPMDLEFSNQMDQALEGIFNSLRLVEDQFRVTYPEIAITPIAIYRE